VSIGKKWFFDAVGIVAVVLREARRSGFVKQG
jgi:hypothetical protein